MNLNEEFESQNQAEKETAQPPSPLEVDPVDENQIIPVADVEVASNGTATIETQEMEIQEDIQHASEETETALLSSESFRDLRDQILKTGGMSKSFALEMFAITNQTNIGMVQTPIGYYTDDPTATEYEVTLENLGKKIYELIQRAIQRLKAMIIKAYHWVVGKPDAGTDPKSVEKDMDEKFRVSQIENQEITELMEDIEDHSMELKSELGRHPLVIKNDKEKEVRLRSLDEVVTSVPQFDVNEYYKAGVAKFLQQEDPFLFDFINDGSFSNTLINWGAGFKKLNTNLMEKFDKIYTFIDFDQVDREALKRAAKEVEYVALIEKPTMTYFNGKEQSFIEVAVFLENLKVEALRKNTKKEINVVGLVNGFKRNIENPKRIELEKGMGAMATTMARYSEILDKLDKAINAKTSNIQTDDEAGEVLRRLVGSLREDLVAMVKIIAIIRGYITQSKQLAYQYLDFLVKTTRVVVREAKQQGQEELIPPELIELNELTKNGSKKDVSPLLKALYRR